MSACAACAPLLNAVLFWRHLDAAARGAPAPGARSAGTDFRQVRPGAVDAPRPAAARHRRRTGQAAGPGAAVSRRTASWRILARVYGKPVDRGVRRLRAVAGRQRLGRAGAFRAACTTAAKSRSRSCAPASRRSSRNDVALLDAGATLIELLWADGKRLKPARSRRRIRQPSRGRTRSHARGGQRQPVAAQFRALAAAAGAGNPLGLLLDRGDGDAAHARHAGVARSTRCARRASTSRNWRAPAWKFSSPRCSATAFSTPTCTPATFSSRRTAATSRSISASWAR